VNTLEYTIGKISSLFKISRSTLLYYDSIDLFKPSYFKPNGYRVYSEEKLFELNNVIKLKETGFTLEEIKRIKRNPGFIPDEDMIRSKISEFISEYGEILNRNKKIKNINGENQEAITSVKDEFVQILKSSGMDENDMKQFHRLFEMKMPGIHELFLSFLGFKDEEIKKFKTDSGNFSV